MLITRHGEFFKAFGVDESKKIFETNLFKFKKSLVQKDCAVLNPVHPHSKKTFHTSPITVSFASLSDWNWLSQKQIDSLEAPKEINHKNLFSKNEARSSKHVHKRRRWKHGGNNEMIPARRVRKYHNRIKELLPSVQEDTYNMDSDNERSTTFESKVPINDNYKSKPNESADKNHNRNDSASSEKRKILIPSEKIRNFAVMNENPDKKSAT